jgi:hypothetical protein
MPALLLVSAPFDPAALRKKLADLLERLQDRPPEPEELLDCGGWDVIDSINHLTEGLNRLPERDGE